MITIIRPDDQVSKLLTVAGVLDGIRAGMFDRKEFETAAALNRCSEILSNVARKIDADNANQVNEGYIIGEICNTCMKGGDGVDGTRERADS